MLAIAMWLCVVTATSGSRRIRSIDLDVVRTELSDKLQTASTKHCFHCI